MPPRQDACDVVNNCLVEYEKSQNILYKKDNAIVLDNNYHISDSTESGKSENFKTKKGARLYLAASSARTETNDTTQHIICK